MRREGEGGRVDGEEERVDGEEKRVDCEEGRDEKRYITDGEKLLEHFLDGKVFLHQLCVYLYEMKEGSLHPLRKLVGPCWREEERGWGADIALWIECMGPKGM